MRRCVGCLARLVLVGVVFQGVAGVASDDPQGVVRRYLRAWQRRDYPAMVNRLVFTTGDTFAADTSQLLRDSGVPSLVKPYDFAKLEDLLHEVAKTSA